MTQGDGAKPRWESPTLQILTRGGRGEAVLGQCRLLDPLYGPSNAESGCFSQAAYGEPCYVCESHELS